MEYTIEDLLNALQNSNQSDGHWFSTEEIWNMVANKESYEKMGFSDEEKLKDWIKNNPYSNL